MSTKTLQAGWESYRRRVVEADGEREESEVYTHRFMLAFYGGAFMYQSLLRRAAAQPEGTAEQLMEALDAEIEHFNMHIAMHALAGVVPN